MLEKNSYENFFLRMEREKFYVVEEIISKGCEDILQIEYMLTKEEYEELLQLLKETKEKEFKKEASNIRENYMKDEFLYPFK